MGNYDNIQVPVSGQPISSSLYGVRARDAILDLDRRLSAYDASTGIAKQFSASNLVLATTAEVAALTITGFTFRAGYAYKVSYRAGAFFSTNTFWCNFRLRKYNATPSAGADWGEYFRVNSLSAQAQTTQCFGIIYLLNATAADVTSDFNLNAHTGTAGAAACTIFATAASPRYLVVEPAGFASDYVGMGVQVS